MELKERAKENKMLLSVYLIKGQLCCLFSLSLRLLPSLAAPERQAPADSSSKEQREITPAS